MSNFDNYVDGILRGTYLTRREKQAWKEELLGHLEEATEAAVHRGAVPDEALKSVITSFGSAAVVRTKIIRETFGVSPVWFLTASAASFLVFVLSLFVNMRVGDVNPTGHLPIPTPQWVLFTNHYLPMSSTMWAGLSVMFFMLIYTRKRVDRISALVSMIPFFIVWIIDRVPHHSSSPRMLFYSPSWASSGPLGVPETTGYVLLFVLCLAMYAWTRNRRVSLISCYVSIALTLWPMVRDTVQTTLWNTTKNPIFWGHSYPDKYSLWYAIFSIVVRFIVVGLILYMSTKMDLASAKKSNAR